VDGRIPSVELARVITRLTKRAPARVPRTRRPV